MQRLSRPLASVLIAVAMAIVIVVVAVLPFLNPLWVGFEQGRAEATAWTGYTTEELRIATDAILADLVIGPPAFDVEVAGEAVLSERERGHMRDVRTVFIGAFILGVAAVVMLVAASRSRDRVATWKAVRTGAAVLAVGILALGGVALVAFDVLFEVMHRLLFAAGSYTFDPGSERLVQLFPFRFWQETAIVVGIVIVALSAIVAAIATWRLEDAATDDQTLPTAPLAEARR